MHSEPGLFLPEYGSVLPLDEEVHDGVHEWAHVVHGWAHGMVELGHEVYMDRDVEALDGGMEQGMDCMGEELDEDGMGQEMGGKVGILASNHEWHLELAMVLDMLDMA